VSTIDERVAAALAVLERKGSTRVREEALTRYGITAPRSYGVRMGEIQKLAKSLGKDHDLAAALWKTGWYEARLLCAYVDEPGKVTTTQMDRWARDFDNWGIVDTICFVLFDQAAGRWSRVEPWCRHEDEFVRRAGFVMLACLGAHDREAPDAGFLKGLKLIERGATDERNFVKKGISWAIRIIGGRNVALNKATRETCERLAASQNPTARSIGKLGLRDLAGASMKKRLERQSRTKARKR
jgi:3-methyladenine DNA glycosylase AlkD